MAIDYACGRPQVTEADLRQAGGFLISTPRSLSGLNADFPVPAAELQETAVCFPFGYRKDELPAEEEFLQKHLWLTRRELSE